MGAEISLLDTVFRFRDVFSSCSLLFDRKVSEKNFGVRNTRQLQQESQCGLARIKVQGRQTRSLIVIFIVSAYLGRKQVGTTQHICTLHKFRRLWLK